MIKRIQRNTREDYLDDKLNRSGMLRVEAEASNLSIAKAEVR